MANFINLAEAGKPEILIDADSVHMIEYRDDTMGATFGNNKGVTLWSKEQGVFATVPAENPGAAQKIVDKICRNKTQNWIKFPVRWPDSNTNENTLRSVCYVDPATFTYAITSVPSEDNNNKIGASRAILLGVEGYGRLESTAVTAGEERNMLATIQNANTGLVLVDPVDASARFYNPGYTLYNPAKVDRIYGDGVQINVIFMQKDRVDFTLNKTPQAQQPKLDVNKHFQQLLASGIDEQEATENVQKLINDRAIEKEEIINKAMNDFARAVAAECPQLDELENASYPVFLRFNDVSSLYTHDDGEVITIHYRKTKQDQYGESQNIYFKNRADLQKALEKFKPTPPRPV